MVFGSKNTSKIDPNDEHRDFRLMESILNDAFEEQKKSRRWGIFFKSLTFTYLFFGIVIFYAAYQKAPTASTNKPHTAAIEINGVILDGEPASAAQINPALRQAFKNDDVVALMLMLNTPGGSPVQAGYIYDEILRLSKEYPDKKVYAVIGDISASGGYYIAAAAHEIYANRSSLVGSIGVTSSGFGFVEAMKKLGIERRHYTAGEHKAFLDPFSPLRETEKEFWDDVLKSTHQQFIDAVSKGRGKRLEINDTITSGLIWNGEQAIELGLIDGLGSPSYVAREIIGEENIIDYTQRQSPIEVLMKDFGLSVGEGVARYFTRQESNVTLH